MRENDSLFSEDLKTWPDGSAVEHSTHKVQGHKFEYRSVLTGKHNSNGQTRGSKVN